jgi:hypothetical protein
VLQGATPVPFLTHVGVVSAGGYVGRLVETAFSAGYSNGQTGQSPDGTAIGQYDTYTGTAQLRLRLRRSWSTVASFTHSQYFLNTVASSALLVSPELHRNSVRIGFVFAVPLVGEYLSNPGPPAVGGN